MSEVRQVMRNLQFCQLWLITTFNRSTLVLSWMDCTLFTYLPANDFLPPFCCMQETHSPLRTSFSVVLHFFPIQHLLALSKDYHDVFISALLFLGLERIMSHHLQLRVGKALSIATGFTLIRARVRRSTVPSWLDCNKAHCQGLYWT
jgi:hypothetical protein